MLALASIVLISSWFHVFGTPPKDPCIEALDPGPCKYFKVQWYWDPDEESCKKFHYGGCMGTRNRFGSKQQCLKQCIYKTHNPVAIPDLCLLPLDAGYCGDDRVGLWWWHFNAEVGHCEKFYYYGCGGNRNRFYSLHSCKKICGEKLSPEVACDRCDARTSRCVSHSKYNFTCECLPGFEKNPHGDCADIDECRTYKATCDKNAWCINTIGSYRCECMAGYREKDKRCHYTGMGTPTMDCNKCDVAASCDSGVCQCKIGYKGDGMQCTDINECLESPYPCDKMATCENTPGAYICKCREGFAGNGYVCSDSSRSCLDPWYRGYEDECAEGVWQERYYYEATTKRCALFWYSACNATSKNHFPNLKTCETLCERAHVLERAKVCWDTFDPYAAEQCGTGRWEQRFYFDPTSLTCRLFWHDGCQGVSRNVFTDLLTCQWLCEVQPMYKSKSCLEDFDEHYKDQCEGGRWRQFYYYDKQSRMCRAFWFDGCRSQSQNIFTNYATCQSVCEEHEFLDANFKSRAKLNVTQAPLQAACDPNPCMNGGMCKAKSNRNLDYDCHCINGFTDARCTTPPEHPCASNPCKNGGTCGEFEEPRKMFRCTCPPGYFGPFCEPDPCLSNPCVNNGTCRTLTGFSTFFCECTARFSGSRCQFDRWTNEVQHWGDMSDQEREMVEELRNPSTTPKPTIKAPAGTWPGGGSVPSLWGPPKPGATAKHTAEYPPDEYLKHVKQLSSGEKTDPKKIEQSLTAHGKIAGRSATLLLETEAPTDAPSLPVVHRKATEIGKNSQSTTVIGGNSNQPISAQQRADKPFKRKRYNNNNRNGEDVGAPKKSISMRLISDPRQVMMLLLFTVFKSIALILV